jgi:hypothetical protein
VDTGRLPVFPGPFWGRRRPPQVRSHSAARRNQGGRRWLPAGGTRPNLAGARGPGSAVNRPVIATTGPAAARGNHGRHPAGPRRATRPEPCRRQVPQSECSVAAASDPAGRRWLSTWSARPSRTR